VLSAAGLEERDLYINEVVTAEYIYENEKGNEVFKKVRMEPKGSRSPGFSTSFQRSSTLSCVSRHQGKGLVILRLKTIVGLIQSFLM
jgi:hypothetical protein